MPGPILHMGAVVTCAHGGQAIPTVPVKPPTAAPEEEAVAPAPVVAPVVVETSGNQPKKQASQSMQQ